MKLFNILFLLDYNRYFKLQNIVLSVAIILSVISFFISMSDMFIYAGIDLRNKVVGARVLLNGGDPYTFEWEPGISDRLLDPNKRHPGRSGATVTPVVLLFYGLFSSLSYTLQRWIWFFLEWCAILSTAIILTRCIGSHRANFLFLCLFFLFFVSGFFWRTHVERGQYYIFISLLMSIGIFLEMKYKGSNYYAGIVYGCLTVIRPTFMIFLLIYIILKKRLIVISATITALIILLFSTILYGFQPWVSYINNVNIIENGFVDNSYYDTIYGPPMSVPNIAEGVNFKKFMFPYYNSNETYLWLAGVLTKHFKITAINLKTKSRIIAGIFMIIIITICFLIRNRKLNYRFIVLFAITSSLIIEFFLPERYAYSDVMFLPLLALVCPLCVYSSKYIGMFIILSLTIGQVLLTLGDGTIGSLLRPVIFIGTITWCLVLYATKIIYNGTILEKSITNKSDSH